MNSNGHSHNPRAVYEAAVAYDQGRKALAGFFPTVSADALETIVQTVVSVGALATPEPVVTPAEQPVIQSSGTRGSKRNIGLTKRVEGYLIEHTTKRKHVPSRQIAEALGVQPKSVTGSLGRLREAGRAKMLGHRGPLGNPRWSFVRD